MRTDAIQVGWLRLQRPETGAFGTDSRPASRKGAPAAPAARPSPAPPSLTRTYNRRGLGPLAVRGVFIDAVA